MARGKKTQAAVQSKIIVKEKTVMKEQANEVVFALDIGTRSIIGMVGKVEEGRVRVLAVEREDHTERAMMDGQIENIEKVAGIAGKVKERLEKKTHIQLSRVCVAAAGRALRTKEAEFELHLPGTQLIDDEIISRLEAGAITRAEEAFDAENAAQEDTRRFYLVGYTVRQYFLDQYTISSLKDHRGQDLKVDLIATFLPSEVVESLYTTMMKIGLEVASLTLEPIAAINAAIPENIRLLNLVMVDIGAGTSDIAACTGGSITGYTMATVAGDEITETIMKQYLVDFPTAEAVKMQLAHQDELTFFNILGMEQKVPAREMFKCIQGAMEALSKEIADKVVEINGKAPSALFLVGGGSKLAGLKDGITDALGMDQNRVTLAGNYFQAQAFSDEYELNNPEYATPIGIMISSGLNLINDSFRVMLNGKPAKLFRSGSFTALNLLMMNGYNFRDIMGRSGANLMVMVNGMRKVFYGTASDPAALYINQKEGKLSDVIHAGDVIEFTPARDGEAGIACLGDIEGAKEAEKITLNGKSVPLSTVLKNGDSVIIKLPLRRVEEVKDDGGNGDEAEKENKGIAGDGHGVGSEKESSVEKLDAENVLPTEEEIETDAEDVQAGVVDADAEAENVQAGVVDADAENVQAGAIEAEAENVQAPAEEGSQIGEEITEKTAEELPDKGMIKTETAEADAQDMMEEKLYFSLNGSSLYLPKKADGRPYYLMDLIQYSGIDLNAPKGRVRLQVNGEEGRFQQVLREGDIVLIREEED